MIFVWTLHWRSIDNFISSPSLPLTSFHTQKPRDSSKFAQVVFFSLSTTWFRHTCLFFTHPSRQLLHEPQRTAVSESLPPSSQWHDRARRRRIPPDCRTSWRNHSPDTWSRRPSSCPSTSLYSPRLRPGPLRASRGRSTADRGGGRRDSRACGSRTSLRWRRWKCCTTWACPSKRRRPSPRARRRPRPAGWRRRRGARGKGRRNSGRDI